MFKVPGWIGRACDTCCRLVTAFGERGWSGCSVTLPGEPGHLTSSLIAYTYIHTHIHKSNEHIFVHLPVMTPAANIYAIQSTSNAGGKLVTVAQRPFSDSHAKLSCTAATALADRPASCCVFQGHADASAELKHAAQIWKQALLADLWHTTSVSTEEDQMKHQWKL